MPVETRSYFSPYVPNERYTAVETVDFNRMGFFEVAPLLLEGSVNKVYASRFDPDQNKKIVFAISPNTPADYKQAVSDGVLYWNKAFGYEKIQVVDAPTGTSAPSSEYNIVQWINWDSAGSAYADAQMDPRSGEIRHAQVFMTSAFAFSSRARARALLRNMAANETKVKNEKTFTLAGLQPSKLCDRENDSQLRSLLVDIVASDLSDEKILEISKDYVREVVAHEIGHTLGLRHNFAGNLSANYELSQLDDMFKKYLESLEVTDGIIHSSSVMEYQDFPGSVMTGRGFLKNSSALPYDQRAIDVLYKNADLAAETPLFCTDSQRGSALGCTVWDQGPSPLADVLYDAKKLQESLPKNLIESIIMAKTMPFGLRNRNISEIPLNPKSVAASLVSDQTFVINTLTKEVRDLRTVRSFSKIDGLNGKAVEEKAIASALAEITKPGGLESLLAPPADSLAANWIAEFNRLIDTPSYRTGKGLDGEEYTLTETEVSEAKALAETYFVAVEAALPGADVNSLVAVKGTLADNDTADNLANILMKRMIEYVSAESGQELKEKVTLGENKSAILSLPIFKYEYDVRLKAMSLLSGKATAAPDWGLIQHNTVKDLWKTKLKSILQDNEISSIRLDKNSRSVAKWLVENRAIKTASEARDN